MVSDGILIAVITIVSNAILWFIQRTINIKTVRLERRKAQADIVKEETDTIQNIITQYNDVSEKYIETAAKLTEMSLEVQYLKNQMETLISENTLLKNKNVGFEYQINALVEERSVLRNMIEIEKEQGLKMRKGIQVLINQLKGFQIKPEWEPE